MGELVKGSNIKGEGFFWRWAREQDRSYWGVGELVKEVVGGELVKGEMRGAARGNKAAEKGPHNTEPSNAQNGKCRLIKGQ